MQFLVLWNQLEDRAMHLPSSGYPIIPSSGDVEMFTILDDDNEIYFTGYIYNSKNATEEEFDEIITFMEEYGATKLIINGDNVLE